MLQLSLTIYIFYIVVVDTNLIPTVVNDIGYHPKTINAYGSLRRIGVCIYHKVSIVLLSYLQ